VLLLSLAVVLVILLALAESVQSRLEFGTFRFWGEPERIDYCGRRYYPGTEVQRTPQQIVGSHSANATWKTVRHTLTRRSVEGPVLPAGSSVCTMSLYISTGDGMYRLYGISGGP